jgi:multiple sugar transport system permease protein
MLLALFISLYAVDGFGNNEFIGLDNYRRMFGDVLFWSALKVTLLYAAMMIPALYVSGLALALLVQETNRFNAVMRSMFFAPQMVSLVVIGLVWQLMVVDKIGIFARSLTALGMEPVSLLGDPRFALLIVTLVSIWFLMGFYMLIFLGGLQDIPKEYYEAARIDGAGRVARFRHITLPLLRPTSFFVLIVSMVAAVAGTQAFDLVYVMTRGGPANSTTLLINYIYQQAFQFGAFGYASAMAALLVASLMAITVAFFLATRGGKFQHD